MKSEMNPYIVYVKTNTEGHIIAVNSSEFLADTTGWIKIDSGFSDRYHHAQGNYFAKPIWIGDGVYRYKLVGDCPVERTAEEIAEQSRKIPGPAEKTIEERMHALEKGISEMRNLLSVLLGKNT
jgi:hypothetical protein